mmetsp:Transcript_17838/g.45724  ORF Transcript_17838/g.45724 Transcript_17838/m.45724 type:complete len:228 (-) Transcript_17838:1450-2133(-)
MTSRTAARSLAPASMCVMNTLLQSERIRTSAPRREAIRMARRDSSGMRYSPSSRSVETITSRDSPRRCISARISLVTDTKEAGISSPSSMGSSSGASSPITDSPASATVTVLSKSISSSVLEPALRSPHTGELPLEAIAPGAPTPLLANHACMPKRLAMSGRTSLSAASDRSNGSTASTRKRSSGSLRNGRMGMPLSGWWRKAIGVSSTSTVRARSRPRRERSFTQE